MVKLRRHTRIFACLKVLSSKREAAYSLYDNIPTPSANREEKFDAMHVTMVIIFLDLIDSTILSFSEMVICIVKQWKKSIGYVLFCS